MDFITECFEQHSGAFTEKLAGAGFSIDQAKQFLPEAASGIFNATQDAGAEQMITGLITGGPSKLISSINITEMASKLGMNSEQISSGLEAIAPLLSQVLSETNNGVVGAVSSLTGGSTADLISSAKKLFN